MYGLVKRNFSINLTVLRFLGLYPPKKHTRLYKIYSLILYILFTVPTPILTFLFLVLDETVNLATVAQNAFAVGETGCFVFKLLQFIINADGIRECIYMLEYPVFNTFSDEEQKRIINDCIGISKRNSKFFLFFCILTVISWAIVPLFGSEYKLPLDVWLPYCVKSGGLPYILSYIFIVLGVSSDAVSNGVIDPLIGGLAYFATTQLKILKHNLQNLHKHTEVAKNDKTIYNKIKLCINHHSAILNFIEKYEKTFSPMVFVQFSASVVVICISCLQLSMVEPLTVSFFSMIIFVNAVLMEILFYSYYGTTLYEESNTLNTAIYMGEWYEYDMKSKKALIVLMERSKKPVIVTSGKILDLSLATFTTILRRSYSLLAVLKNY